MIDYYEISDPPPWLDLKLLDQVILFGCKELKIVGQMLIIEFNHLEECEFGFCIYDKEETTIIISKDLDEKDMIRTLFHELAHVSQHIEGRFEQERKQSYRDASSYDVYMQTPWEQEAFQQETELLEKFYL